MGGRGWGGVGRAGRGAGAGGGGGARGGGGRRGWGGGAPRAAQHAADTDLGRRATTAAHLLPGKHTAIYPPHMDMGDFVIIINADKVHL
ncbi:uL13 family ribosomal protein, partial [Streptomyces sp. BE230]|nr:uL13 family ribosomal protein [Streptomyces sp. BE230]